ncbi:hypothetical protein FGG08_002363 [Glutinoglossum americanum]|uniref:Uncharacterized protein n=1 Tax=Glutinoglossum americanum TaxID=1670608 RepID=A0A9P8ID05_9PEZI|nr:hypothetical protein FGG08_002363 [Glutinoglossum americanum]
MHTAGSSPEISDTKKSPVKADEEKSGKTSDPTLGVPPRAVMATIQDDDERMLARIGYRQEFWGQYLQPLTIHSTQEVLPLPSGAGSLALAWQCASQAQVSNAVSIRRLPDRFAVAELVSAYPTAGGMYFVTKHVVPPEYVPIWAWIVGWCNFLGQTAGVSSVAYTVSQMILACGSMNSHFDGQNYLYSP